MSLLDEIKTGKIAVAPRLFLYGVEGVGKSTFAANAPKPIFIQTEDGLNSIDCAKFPLCVDFEKCIDYLRTLWSEQHDYATVVIDSVDWLERMIWDAVCKKYGENPGCIEKVDKGYGRGYLYALIYWRELINALDHMRAKNMTVVLIAHAKIEKFEDPESISYDRYSPRLHKHAMGLLTEWADAVLFAAYKKEFRIEKEDAGFNRDRAVAVPFAKDGASRVLRCICSPTCVAKNRYDMPNEIPLSWPEAEKFWPKPEPKKTNGKVKNGNA